MPKLRVIIKPPPEPQGDAEQQTEALRDYLLQMSEELAYVLTHLEADNINDSTFERIQSMIPRPYTGLPVMDGDASSGQSEQWARGDHRHGHDSTKADVTALEETAGDLADHVADIGNPHEVTAAQVGLGNVDNVRQYSASNPPPIPTPGEVGAIPTTEKGSAGGVAELDSNGMVPSAQLPSYVDDVLEYASLSAFPVTGESGKIYVALDTGRTYRWSGSAYTEISESLALGETSSTAYRGDRGKTAYDHSQVTSGNPHNVTAAEVGARADTWTPSAADVGAQPSITANGILKGDGLGGVSAASAGTDYQAPLTAGTDYQTPLVAGTDYATPGMIPSVPDPSDAAPQDLGTADAGSSGDYSRADHVHNLPDADDIPYDNTESGLSAIDVQAAIDEVAQGGGGGGPSPATATPVMDGTGGVGSSLLYAREDHEHPSDTAKQDKITASGILKGDGAGGVSAATAGTDYQAPLTAGTDYATPGMIPTVPSAYTSNPEMDGTASPGSSGAWAKGDHVHPSDTTKANQAQLAYVETGTTTASRNYAVGEYFCLGGKTCRAKTAINAGATLTLNTNYEEVPSGGFNAIAPKLLMNEFVTGTGDYSIASLWSYNLFIVRVIGNNVNFRTLVVPPGVSTQINVDATASIYVRMTMLIDYINLKVSVTNISSSAWAGGTLQVWGVALPV